MLSYLVKTVTFLEPFHSNIVQLLQLFCSVLYQKVRAKIV